MSDLLSSAFASFLDHRRAAHPPAHPSSVHPYPNLPPLRPPSPPPPKRHRAHHNIPNVRIPQTSAPPSLISPVSVLQSPHLLSPPTSHPHSTNPDQYLTHHDVSPRPISQKRTFSQLSSPISQPHNSTSITPRPRPSSRQFHRPPFDSPESRLISCSHCHQSFRSEAQLQHHNGIAHQRPFACKIERCAASFGKQNHLSRHIRIVHNKERPFACQQPGCGSRFGSKSHLGDHTRAVHMRLRNFKCGICNASWSKRFNLEKHIRIRHLGEKPFRCALCHLSFGTRSHVTRHEIKVHKRPIP